VERDEAPTAKTDNSFSILGLAHFLQATSVVEEGTIFSKVVPHSRHLNSKSGIRTSCVDYSQTPARLQSLGRELGGGFYAGATAGAFYLAFSGAPH
jgi:hypothetical protein